VSQFLLTYHELTFTRPRKPYCHLEIIIQAIEHLLCPRPYAKEVLAPAHFADEGTHLIILQNPPQGGFLMAGKEYSVSCLPSKQ
jgi:hypothetical protein